MKKVLIINGHPDKRSYNHALSDVYLEGVKKTNSPVSRLNISDLYFNPNLEYGYRLTTQLEPDLQQAIEKIKEADHLVWLFPMWWYGLPALMKGFIDRTFLPGVAFESIEGKKMQKGLLTGKSARVIITADTPGWYDFLVMKRPAINQFKKGTLQFCGVNPVKISFFAPIKNSSLEQREKWLGEVRRLGELLK